MKGLLCRLALFYPRWWRERYGREFETLIEDSDLRWRDVIDVIVSAIEMKMKPAPEPHILSLASRDVPGGYELESTVAIPKNGATTLVRYFNREIDLGDSYVTVNHSSRDGAPAQTVLIFGRKGEIDGDFRTDETEMLVFESDGTVRRTEQTVKTYLKWDSIRTRLRERYREGLAAGLTADEIHRQIQDDDHFPR
ncbi:MAG TPA: hypothetical protein VFW44_08270 [Bryobacteraceae bacterium]|nr:hypothetical protein [Bryobacteraceae bacterium]